MSDVVSFDRYALPGLLSVAGMHQIIRFALEVGMARRRHKVPVPHTDGPDEFVRTFRAHQNALESYTLSLSSLWLGSVFGHPVPASVLYGGYLIGREAAFWGYCESSEKRLPGIYFSYRCILGLILMVTAGAGNSLLRSYADIDVIHIVRDKVSFLCDTLYDTLYDILIIKIIDWIY